ncbi:MAG: hypothetical protein OEV14_10690, partial [Gammaproteobacteria bacterium]|nr:hypothetical protein [Gammaproteobacteria bacterium]
AEASCLGLGADAGREWPRGYLLLKSSRTLSGSITGAFSAGGALSCGRAPAMANVRRSRFT